MVAGRNGWRCEIETVEGAGNPKHELIGVKGTGNLNFDGFDARCEAQSHRGWGWS